MDVKRNSQIRFTSVNHPVKPFLIQTNDNVIKFKEWDYDKLPKKSALKEIAKFFLDNFANQSSHPFWKTCRKGTPTFIKSTYNNYVNFLVLNYKEQLKNPDTTLMLGRDKNGKISAAILAEPLNLTPIVKDNKTLYIDSIAVDKNYRGNHIGKRLINDVVKSINERYTDVFLVAYNESVPFYKKLGFVSLNNKYYAQRKIIDSLSEERKDYPEYASFLTKPIDNNKPRWFDKFKKWYNF